MRLGRDRHRRGRVLGLFGVGGGTIIVPLLVLWLGYEQREATGTSLAAIAIIGALAAAAHAAYGNVDLGTGLLVAAPGDRRACSPAPPSSSASPSARWRGAFVVLLVASAAVLIF